MGGRDSRLGSTRRLVLGEFERLGRAVRYRKGEVLFREGDPSDSAVAVRTGRVAVETVTPEGRGVLLAVAGPGDVLGEIGALLEQPRAATATAVDDVDALEVGADSLRASMEEWPPLARALVRQLSRRVRSDVASRTAREHATVEARLCASLAVLVARAREYTHFEGSIELRLTQEDLAAWVGASREEVTRALGRLRADGIVKTGRGVLEVPDDELLMRRVVP